MNANVERSEVKATDQEIEAAFDELGYGVTVKGLAFATADQIAQFKGDRKTWNEWGKVKEDTTDLFVVANAQAVKGQERRDVAVVRFGEHCAIMGLDR